MYAETRLLTIEQQCVSLYVLTTFQADMLSATVTHDCINKGAEYRNMLNKMNEIYVKTINRQVSCKIRLISFCQFQSTW